MKLSGPQQIAALLLTLDRPVAATLMRNLGDRELSKVGQAMAALQDVVLPDDVLQELLLDYHRRLRSKGVGGLVASQEIQNLFKEALGPDKGIQALDDAYDAIVTQRPFANLEDLSPDELLAMLREEHPQVIALILSHLSTAKATAVVSALPKEAQVDIVRRMATREPTSPELIDQLARSMTSFGAKNGARVAATTGTPLIKSVAEMLNQIDSDLEKDILGELRQSDPELADSIEEHRFGFADLLNIDKKSMQKILSNIDTRDLALALKAADPAVEQHILDNMSKRSRVIVIEEREVLGPTPLSEVTEAQKDILATVRSLIEAGDIKMTRGSNEEMVT